MQKTTENTIHFSLDQGSGIPVYKQIIFQTEMAIADKRVKSGDRLPTIRELAAKLNINPNTAARAYNELERSGMVLTQQGKGTFIRGKNIEIKKERKNEILLSMTRRFVSTASAYGYSISELIATLQTFNQTENKQNTI